MTIRELCEKEVIQLEQGVCLGRADDLELDPATAQLQSLILLGRPRLLGLLGILRGCISVCMVIKTGVIIFVTHTDASFLVFMLTV